MCVSVCVCLSVCLSVRVCVCVCVCKQNVVLTDHCALGEVCVCFDNNLVFCQVVNRLVYQYCTTWK